jgi:hypothetical protein
MPIARAESRGGPTTGELAVVCLLSRHSGAPRAGQSPHAWHNSAFGSSEWPETMVVSCFLEMGCVNLTSGRFGTKFMGT